MVARYSPGDPEPKLPVWPFVVFLVWLWLVLCVCQGCTPSRSPEYPRHDCRTGGEFTYHSDGSWDATVRGDCGKAWD